MSGTVEITTREQGFPMRVRMIVIAAIAMMAAGCQGASTSGASATPRAVTQIPTAGSVVIGRASQPTQTNATGIQFTSGELNVTLYSNSIDISARDWNTITNTSIVPQDIAVSVDPNIHGNETTRNRFQYLADRMFPFIKSSFNAIGITSVPKGGNDISIVAFLNPTIDTYELAGLTLSVKLGPPITTISSANFYTTPDTSLTIPAKTIYFAWLEASLTAKPPHGFTQVSFNFNWSWLYDCGRLACPRPSI